MSDENVIRCVRVLECKSYNCSCCESTGNITMSSAEDDHLLNDVNMCRIHNNVECVGIHLAPQILCVYVNKPILY